MTLSEFNNHLAGLKEIGFQLPNGSFVPPYFHVTEVGKVSKHFIDCGGTIRKENVVSFQLWSSTDYDHRLNPEKLQSIVGLAQNTLEIGDLSIEVEYQGQTIEKFGLEYNGSHFLLTQKMTDCLAKDNCGIPIEKPKKILSSLQSNNGCTQGSGCC